MHSDGEAKVFKLAMGITLRIQIAQPDKWGVWLILATGTDGHIRKLNADMNNLGTLLRSKDRYADEASVYRELGLNYIEPELREAFDEVALSRKGLLPCLVSLEDIRGELHAHSVASDGVNTIEEMAAAAQLKGYEHIGISDHSRSLKIAGGLSEADLWQQVRLIDKLNEKDSSVRILKSAEVDIPADGSLDYPDELLKELDYTVCSIHSKFGLNKRDQTARLLRAMDNPCCTILGHLTGRLLLKRPGYEIKRSESSSMPDKRDVFSKLIRARIAWTCRRRMPGLLRKLA